MAINLIHSVSIPEAYLRGLDNLLPGMVRTAIPASEDVYGSISSHPDIFIFSFDYKTFVISGKVPEHVTGVLKCSGARTIISGSMPRGKYPDTAPLNAVRVGRFIIHNTKHTDISIKRLAEEEGIALIHVNQGYARCSTIPVGTDAIITCDPCISKAASAAGLDVKLISSGNLLLLGQKYGFIGGASGILQDGRVVFLGDILRHPDHESILSFMDKHRVNYLCIDGLDLFDAGSLIFF